MHNKTLLHKEFAQNFSIKKLVVYLGIIFALLILPISIIEILRSGSLRFDNNPINSEFSQGLIQIPFTSLVINLNTDSGKYFLYGIIMVIFGMFFMMFSLTYILRSKKIRKKPKIKWLHYITFCIQIKIVCFYFICKTVTPVNCTLVYYKICKGDFVYLIFRF